MPEHVFFIQPFYIYLLFVTGLLFLAHAQACIFELAAGAEPSFHGMFIYFSQGLGHWSLNINMCWGILASWPRPDRFGSSLSSYITLMPFHVIFPVTVCYIFSFGPGPPCILHSEKAHRKTHISHALEGAALYYIVLLYLLLYYIILYYITVHNETAYTFVLEFDPGEPGDCYFTGWDVQVRENYSEPNVTDMYLRTLGIT